MISTYKESDVSLTSMFKFCMNCMIMFMLIYISKLLY